MLFSFEIRDEMNYLNHFAAYKVSYRTPDQTSAEGTSFVRSSINCLWYGTRQQSWEHFPTKILKFGAF